jgi:hypothetical protein
VAWHIQQKLSLEKDLKRQEEQSPSQTPRICSMAAVGTTLPGASRLLQSHEVHWLPSWRQDGASPASMTFMLQAKTSMKTWMVW